MYADDGTLQQLACWYQKERCQVRKTYTSRCLDVTTISLRSQVDPYLASMPTYVSGTPACISASILRHSVLCSDTVKRDY